MGDLPDGLTVMLVVVPIVGVLLLRLRAHGPVTLTKERELVAAERAARDLLVAEHADLLAAADATRRELESARRELEPERQRLEDVTVRRATMSAAVEALQVQLQRTRALVDEANADLARHQAMRAEAEQALRTAQTGLAGIAHASARRSPAEASLEASMQAAPLRTPSRPRPQPTLDLDAIMRAVETRVPEAALAGVVRAVRASEAMPHVVPTEGGD